MSDELSREDIEVLKARDGLLRRLDLGLEVEAELRGNRPLRVLMERLREDADLAMQEFATANPADTKLITDLQARVFRFTYSLETWERLIAAGHQAGMAVTEGDPGERLD